MEGPLAGLPIALRAIRLQAGWTQKRWAETCGLHPALVSRYERGITNPSLTTLGNLLVAIGSSVRKLDDALKAADRLLASSETEARADATRFSNQQILDALARQLAERSEG